MLRIHPAFYLALTLLGLLFAYWGIEALTRPELEVSRGALTFWVIIDLIVTLACAVLGGALFFTRDRDTGGRSLSTYRPPHVPKGSSGPSFAPRANLDWSRHGDVPRNSSGRGPLGGRR